MRAAWVVVAVVVSACVQAGDVPCDNDRVCPNEYHQLVPSSRWPTTRRMRERSSGAESRRVSATAWTTFSSVVPPWIGDKIAAYDAESVAAEGCRAGVDLDGDMKVGCADDDCWGICTPLCPRGSTSVSCTMLPRCGDSTCDPVESCRTCPADCVTGCSSRPVECGDGFCDSAEAVATCPGDCG
jgi:hypothetical protein